MFCLCFPRYVLATLFSFTFEAVSSTTVTTFWYLYWTLPHFNGVLSGTEAFFAIRFVTCDSCNIYRSQSAICTCLWFIITVLVIFRYFLFPQTEKTNTRRLHLCFCVCLCGPSLVSERVSDLASFLYDHDPDPIANPVENSCTMASVMKAPDCVVSQFTNRGLCY